MIVKINKRIITIAIILLMSGALLFVINSKQTEQQVVSGDRKLLAKFENLKANGNSFCTDKVSKLTGDRLQGSCCSPMDFHRYEEQVLGLKKYKDVPEIPTDPYDIDRKSAEKLQAYYDMELSSTEQQAYDYAMQHSDEKGPCCCKCWRWFVYGGLAKKLIRERNFTGEQITEVWNLSDGCGGPGDHVGHIG